MFIIENHFRLLGTPILIATFLLCGCSGDEKIYRVTGTVRCKGQPVPGVIVHFVPANGRPSTGSTDDNGVFKLSYDKKTEGAASGKHKVYFSFRPQSPKDEIALQKGNAKLAAETKAAIGKYGSTEKSTLVYEVNSDNQVIDINLD